MIMLNPRMKTYPRPLPVRVRRLRAKKVAKALASNPKKSKATPPWLMQARTVVHRQIAREGMEPKKYEVSHLDQATGKVKVKSFGNRASAERYLKSHRGGSLTLLVKDRQDRLRSIPYPSKYTGKAAKTYYMGKLFVANKSKAQYKRTRIAMPDEFAKGSFRTITPGSGRHKLVVACPKGKYRGGACTAGMEVQSVLTHLNPSLAAALKRHVTRFRLGWSFNTKAQAQKYRKVLQADFGSRFYYRVAPVSIEGRKQYGVFLKVNTKFGKNPGYLAKMTAAAKVAAKKKAAELAPVLKAKAKTAVEAAMKSLAKNPGPVYGPGKVEYRTVDTRTEKGLKEAERLKEQGWYVGSVGLYTIQFYRAKDKSRRNPAHCLCSDPVAGAYRARTVPRERPVSPPPPPKKNIAFAGEAERDAWQREVTRRLMRAFPKTFHLLNLKKIFDAADKLYAKGLSPVRAVRTLGKMPLWTLKNPGPAYHKREAKRYSKMLAGDLKAGHKDAAEYWQGALSAEAASVAAGRVVRNPKLSKQQIKARLKYLRGEIEAERISYGEIVELQSLAKYIEPGDTLLLEWAGIPESKVKRNPLLMVVPNGKRVTWYITKLPFSGGTFNGTGRLTGRKKGGTLEVRVERSSSRQFPRGSLVWLTPQQLGLTTRRNPSEARRIFNYLKSSRSASQQGRAVIERGPSGTVVMFLFKDGTAASVDSMEEAREIAGKRFRRNPSNLAYHRMFASAARERSIPEQHQLKIALSTLRMAPAMARVMGGMSHDEAKKFLKSVGYTDAQIAKLTKNPGVRYHQSSAKLAMDKADHGGIEDEKERMYYKGVAAAHYHSAEDARHFRRQATRRAKKNPVPASMSVVMNRGDDMQSLMKDPRFRKAVELYRKFHGCDPKSVSRRLIPVGGKKVVGREFFVSLGKAPSESYTPPARSKKAGNIYVHPYDRKPEKVVSADGKTIITLPGSHKVTDWIRG